MEDGPRSGRVLTSLCILCGLLVPPAAGPAAAEARREPRLLTVDDQFRIGQVGDPRISPDGEWLAYTVTRADLEEDETRTRIWMVPTQGGAALPLTAPEHTSSSPRWSPDGRYLAFLSARGGDGNEEGKAQVFTLYRGGGEAVQRTDTPQDVAFFEWSPDGQKMLLVLKDASPEELAAKRAEEEGETYEQKTAPPKVVTRRQFKLDYVGYLDERRYHLYVLDLATQKLRQLTFGDFDDYCQPYLPGCPASQPAWSPDGTRIAFVSNRTADPDANYNTDVWVVRTDGQGAGAEPLRITSNPGPDGSPSWSRDGKRIAHTSNLETDAALYATHHLATSSSEGGDTRLLTRELDRMIVGPRFSRHDDSIYFLLEYAGELALARVPASGGAVERLVDGTRVVTDFHQDPSSPALALLVSEPHSPGEVFVLDGGRLEQRSRVNAGLLASLRLGEVAKVGFASPDGTPIEAFAIRPPGASPRRRYPAILLIHGGPQSQYDFRFDFEAQLYAANGYLVVMPNPRGSTGYGQDFCMAIWQGWGERDYEDVMAAVDHVVAQGWADPDRLGVAGWSYGGMLTNHVITRTQRFKAAATGASAALYVVNYGHDQYQRWWTFELGRPWEPESRQRYEVISPFNRVANVVTPTLILGGQEDWNVPIINSEQLFLALKTLGVPSELVVYPGEFHGIDTPSNARDLSQRYLAWFGRYLKGEKSQEGGP